MKVRWYTKLEYQTKLQWKVKLSGRQNPSVDEIQGVDISGFVVAPTTVHIPYGHVGVSSGGPRRQTRYFFYSETQMILVDRKANIGEKYKVI